MLTDKPEEDAGHIPVALGIPAPGSEALFRNTSKSYCGSLRLLGRQLSEGVPGTSGHTARRSSEHLAPASRHHRGPQK